MNRIIISIAVAGCIASAQAIEWDAKEWTVGGGIGYASLTSEGFESGPSFSLLTGLNVPLLVERHLRASPNIQFNYIPAVPDEAEGQYGGNFVSTSAALFIEHDLSIAGQKWWLGFAPQISANYVIGQYQWQQVNARLEASEVDSEYAFSAELLTRITIPVLSSVDASIVGQFSPMDGSFHSAFVNFVFHL